MPCHTAEPMHFDRNWIERPNETAAKEPVVRRLSESERLYGGVQNRMFCCEDADKERRGSKRMPIERDVRYTVLGVKAAAGSGRTVNISSGGVLFTTQSQLTEGAEVELAISWPALLNNLIPLKLVVTGRLTRSDGAQAAMHIEKYEFKTRGFKGL